MTLMRLTHGHVLPMKRWRKKVGRRWLAHRAYRSLPSRGWTARINRDGPRFYDNQMRRIMRRYETATKTQYDTTRPAISYLFGR